MDAFRLRRLVEFADTDMAGILHFANYFRYLEAAEHAYLRACGLAVVLHYDGKTVSFPRVSASCEYLEPARFQDVLDIEVRVEHTGQSSIRYAFTVLRDEKPLARARFTVVLCRLLPGHGLEKIAIPDPLRVQILSRTPPAGG